MSTTAAPEKPAPEPLALEEPLPLQRTDLSALQEEMRLIDLRDLARRTQESLAARAPRDDSDAPLDLREAVLLVDSLAPSALQATSIEIEEEAMRPAESTRAPILTPIPTPTDPTQRRWRAAGSGVALLLVMGALVAVKARLGHEETSEALTPERTDPTAPTDPVAPVSSTHNLLAKDDPVNAPASSPSPQVSAAPKRAPVAHPVLPPAPRPRAPLAAASAENRAAAEPTAAPRVDLLDAMQAAVSRHSAPPGAPKGDCPPSSGAAPGSPTPCPRTTPKTSTLP